MESFKNLIPQVILLFFIWKMILNHDRSEEEEVEGCGRDVDDDPSKVTLGAFECMNMCRINLNYCVRESGRLVVAVN